MSVFGEIAKNVGKEVAEGLAKNVEPVVKKAAKNVVDTVEGWGFEPKIGEVSGTKYMKAEKIVKATDPRNINNKDYDKHYNIKDKFETQLTDAVDKGKLSYFSNLTDYGFANVFSNLEKQGVPRKYTGKLAQYYDKNRVDDLDGTDKIVNKKIKQFAIDTANTLKELNPPQRDVYIHLLTTKPSGSPRHKLLTKILLKDLTRPEQETFASLLPQWEGSLKDLVQVAKDMTP